MTVMKIKLDNASKALSSLPSKTITGSDIFIKSKQQTLSLPSQRLLSG